MITTNIESHTLGHTPWGDKIVEKLETIHTRKINRMVLRNRVRRNQGLGSVPNRAFRHRVTGNSDKKTREPSWFAEKWKELV